MTTTGKPKPLTGQELLDKVTSMGNADPKEKARACGYVTYTKNGQERVNLMQFNNALLKAIGVDLGTSDENGSAVALLPSGFRFIRTATS
jgi:hypothetical protein